MIWMEGIGLSEKFGRWGWMLCEGRRWALRGGAGQAEPDEVALPVLGAHLRAVHEEEHGLAALELQARDAALRARLDRGEFLMCGSCYDDILDVLYAEETFSHENAEVQEIRLRRHAFRIWD